MGDRRDTADESGISPTRGRFISPSKGRPYIGHGTAVFFLNGKSLHPIRMNILELRRQKDLIPSICLIGGYVKIFYPKITPLSGHLQVGKRTTMARLYREQRLMLSSFFFRDIIFFYLSRQIKICFRVLNIYVPVISKTLEHIETFNTNCKVVS